MCLFVGNSLRTLIESANLYINIVKSCRCRGLKVPIMSYIFPKQRLYSLEITTKYCSFETLTVIVQQGKIEENHATVGVNR